MPLEKQPTVVWWPQDREDRFLQILVDEMAPEATNVDKG